MSHANGAIKFNDGLIRYYEYDGTSDYVISHHYERQQKFMLTGGCGMRLNAYAVKRNLLVFTLIMRTAFIWKA